MKKDTIRKQDEVTAEEVARRRSEAAKKAAATRKAKVEATRKAEEEAKAKAEAEKTSDAAVAIVDGTEAKAEATADTANAKVATDGTKAEASSSAIIVLPAGDTGKNEANTQSDQYVAPATNSENTKNKKEGTMKKVLSFLGWVFALVLLALLVVALLCTKGCNGVATKSTPSAISDTSADAEAKISALSAALAEQKAENEALRAQLSATQAPVNVNVDNSNYVNVDLSQYVDITTYNQLLSECENVKIENTSLKAYAEGLEGELSIWNGHVCPTGECGVQIVYRDREVEKTVTVTDTDEVDRLNRELASRDAEISRLRGQLADALDELANLKEQIRKHKCPSCDGSCSYCESLKEELEKKDRKIQELEAELEGWSHHVCSGGCDGNCWYAQMWNNHTCSGCDGSCECGGSTGTSTGGTGAHNPGPRADQERPKVEAEGTDEDATTGAAHNPPQRP